MKKLPIKELKNLHNYRASQYEENTIKTNFKRDGGKKKWKSLSRYKVALMTKSFPQV